MQLRCAPPLSSTQPFPLPAMPAADWQRPCTALCTARLTPDDALCAGFRAHQAPTPTPARDDRQPGEQSGCLHLPIGKSSTRDARLLLVSFYLLVQRLGDIIHVLDS